MKSSAKKGHFRHGKPETKDLITKSIIQIRLRTKVKQEFFGHVCHGKMYENEEARIASKIWLELPFEFHNIKLLHYDVLPDEFIAIIEIDHILSQLIPAQVKYNRNGNWKLRAETMLKKERCRILITGLVARFKSRTTSLLNRLHGKQARILWEQNHEEIEITAMPINAVSYFLEKSITANLQTAEIIF